MPAKKKASKALVPAQKKLGRPSSFTEEQAEEICRRLADGESLRHICLLAHMPSKTTILRWLDEIPSFRTQYAHAREKQADAFLDQIQEIAHDGRNDWEIQEAERTGQDRIVLHAEHVQRSRLRVDTLKWVMSKLAPKKYGDKLDIEHSGKTNVEVDVYIGGVKVE
jgi:hypothetical protein